MAKTKQILKTDKPTDVLTIFHFNFGKRLIAGGAMISFVLIFFVITVCLAKNFSRDGKPKYKEKIIVKHII